MEGSSVSESSKDELMAEGRRAMACKEYPQAVNAFQEACELLSKQYGQVSKEMGEPSYLYGKALLELARMENALFGGGVPTAQNEDQSDNEEEEEELGAKDHTPTESSQSCPAPGGSAAGSDQQMAADTATPTNQQEEEPTTLELAWEIFEVARVIFEQSDTVEEKLKLADICMLLGEVSLESDQFERAIDDFTSCLKIRELVLKADNRLLAEVHFQLGLAYTFTLNFDEAITEYESAKQVLELKKEILQGQLERKEGAMATIETEISELDELIPDIDSKINDVYEVKKKHLEISGNESEEQIVSSTTADDLSSKQASSNVQISDISHLVRRKPKVNGRQDPSKQEDISSTEGVKLSRKRSISEQMSTTCPNDSTPSSSDTPTEPKKSRLSPEQ